jgi:O-antigen biosynthesis protein WbqV
MPRWSGRALDEIAAAARGGHAKLALAQLARLVPEFDHMRDPAALGSVGK